MRHSIALNVSAYCLNLLLMHIYPCNSLRHGAHRLMVHPRNEQITVGLILGGLRSSGPQHVVHVIKYGMK